MDFEEAQNLDNNDQNLKIQKRRIKILKYLFPFFIPLIFILICLLLFSNKEKKDKNKQIIVNSFVKKLDRNNFKSILNERRIFEMNYSYEPYMNIDKSISYDQNADIIYNKTGILNITKLDYYYNGIFKDTSNLNHIHISMGFDVNFIELSSIAIASVFNTSYPNTYIHLHIMAINFSFIHMKKIIQLKRFHENVDFIFYNSIQAEYDFGERASKEYRGIGDYTRILAPEIVNDTDRILIVDTGDVIAQKDISEVYNFDLGDNYFAWILEDTAGNEYADENKFFRNNFYPNTGICLINVKLWRENDLYKKSILVSRSYHILPCPYQDIIFVVSDFKFKYMPLKYNCKLFFETDEQMKNKDVNSKYIKKWIDNQKYSPYRYSVEEILEAALDPVINHIYQEKIYKGVGCNKLTIQWLKYATTSGFYEEIKKKYPIPFETCGHLI